MLVIEQTGTPFPERWADINWSAVEARVTRLQGRIYRATERKDWKQAKSLQKLLTQSLAAKLKAIRQVTQENSGKHTPGVDGVVIDTPQKRLALLKKGLNLKGYKPKPVKRNRLN